MKREDITALFPDSTKEQLDKIMALHGSDINNARGGVDTLQQQLTAASAELEELAEALQIEFDEDVDCDTVNGLVLSCMDSIPADGETPDVETCGLKIHVEKIEQRRVVTAIVEKQITESLE